MYQGRSIAHYTGTGGSQSPNLTDVTRAEALMIELFLYDKSNGAKMRANPTLNVLETLVQIKDGAHQSSVSTPRDSYDNLCNLVLERMNKLGGSLENEYPGFQNKWEKFDDMMKILYIGTMQEVMEIGSERWGKPINL